MRCTYDAEKYLSVGWERQGEWQGGYGESEMRRVNGGGGHAIF